MKRRNFIIGAVGLGVGAAFWLKPGDLGASYAPYFEALNGALKTHGPYKPCLVIDLDRLDKNISALLAGFDTASRYRIVAKSLPSPKLLGHIMERAATRSLMLFHQPFINHVASEFPDADILLGKPMPVKSAALFYSTFANQSGFDPSRQLQWLIDTEARLVQYQELAKAFNLKMRINVEIDVGLHRGGVTDTAAFVSIINRIQSDPEHLVLAGLMGYDPHVVKLPKLIKSADEAYADSQQVYGSFIELLRRNFTEIDCGALCLNGAGSPTLAFHKEKTVANDLSAGSCLVKPTDFDIPTLDGFVPASFIATPVLKKLASTTIPAIEFCKGLFEWWDPNMAQSFFIYGGEWKAQYESPKGLVHNPLYGRSTNQQLVNGSNRIALAVDDHIFLRPQQSEFVFLQFGDLLVLKDGRLIDSWPILKQ